MTIVFDENGDGPRTHALVVGVGDYPHCADFPGEGALAAAVRSFKQVLGPPRSARAVADWLVRHQAGNDFAPLGSVELLVPGEEGVTVADFERAFDRWFARCDEREDNVAFFFFSGHGCAKEGQLILFEDFGRSRHNPFTGSVKVDVLVRGMEKCRAEVQCYFIDACRDLPGTLLDTASVQAYAVIQPATERRWLESVVLFATGPGLTAPGSPDDLTPFTKALLQALAGAAATQDTDDLWEIKTGSLVNSMNAVLRWQNREHRGFWASGDYTGERTIRHLPGAPEVPFRLGCRPREALSRATLTLTCSDAVTQLSREPVPAPWEDRAPAAVYTLNACFDGQGYVDAHTSQLIIYPPNKAFDLPVRGV